MSTLKDTIKIFYDQQLSAKDGADTVIANNPEVQALEAADFPSIKEEEWKYTNLKKVLNQSYTLSAPTGQLAKHSLSEGTEAIHLYFSNGIFQGDALPKDLPAGLSIRVMEDAGENVQPPHHPTIFETINKVVGAPGLKIEVAANALIEVPVFIHHNYSSADQALFSNPRIHISIARGGSAKIVEFSIQDGESTLLINSRTSVEVAENGRLEHVVLQDGNSEYNEVAGTTTTQQRDSVYTNTTLSFSGGIVRNNLDLVLEGENIESNMFGLYMLDGKTHVDNHTTVNHKEPNCVSNQLYKGILNDKATAVFNGKIFVQQKAQKTNAFQSNQNIILNSGAKVNTKPQLEIWADDVKCSHGATIGSLDEESIFYLQSRGVPKDKAKVFLVNAFSNEVLDKISLETLREKIRVFAFQE